MRALQVHHLQWPGNVSHPEMVERNVANSSFEKNMTGDSSQQDWPPLIWKRSICSELKSVKRQNRSQRCREYIEVLVLFRYNILRNVFFSCQWPILQGCE
eukprot:scaffold6271_cov171-Amphora_coffeaeformis.AAC.6